MKLRKVFLIFSSTLILSTLACNISTQAPTSNGQQSAVETVVAQTLQAVPSSTLQALNSPVPQASPIISATPTLSTPTQTLTPKPSITPTYSVPILTINENTNCRTGPGQTYDIIFTFLPGSKAEIVGADLQDGYWIVKLPDSGKTCWAWGQYTSTSGSYWVVPTLTAPPTATPAAPDAPGLKSWNYQCTWNGANNDLTMILSWSDRSDNEAGFRVIRNDQVVTELPADSTSYTDIYAVNSGVSVTYRVEAFNDTGTSSTKTISEVCQ